MCLMVVLGAGVCVVQAQDRIKMCGRELIRLAVSYCGNSRLRRSLPDVELGQQEHTIHCKFYFFFFVTNQLLAWIIYEVGSQDLVTFKS